MIDVDIQELDINSNEYRCIECDNIINSKLYIHNFWMVHNNCKTHIITGYPLCEICNDLSQNFVSEDYDYGTMFDSVNNEIEEALEINKDIIDDYLESERFVNLKPAAKLVLLDMFDKILEFKNV